MSLNGFLNKIWIKKPFKVDFESKSESERSSKGQEVVRVDFYTKHVLKCR